MKKLPRWLSRTLDHALTGVAVVALVAAGAKYLAPRASEPLGTLSSKTLWAQGPVTLLELSATA